MRASSLRPHPRRIASLIVALVLLTIGVWTVASGAATVHRGARPRLIMRDRNPVTIDGSGFRPQRRVRVTLTAERMFVRRLIASPRGTFTATFPTAVDFCTGWFVSASQRHGATITLRGAKPECAPAPTR